MSHSSRTSPIHLYFVDGVGGTKICIRCKRSYGPNTDNSTWIKHLVKKHPALHKEYKDEILRRQSMAISSSTALSTPVLASSSSSSAYSVSSASSSSSVSSSVSVASSSSEVEPGDKRCHSIFSTSSNGSEHRLKQPRIDSMMGIQLQQEMYDQLALSFALDSLPLSLVESSDFNQTASVLRKFPHLSLPSRYTLKKHQMRIAERIREQVIARLRGSQCFVGLAIDGWTNVRHEKVMNVIPICQGIAYYWKSIVNGLVNNSAPNQYKALKPVIKDMIDNKIYIVSIIADNEAVNDALFKLISEDYHFFIKVPCAAHTIQLCVKHVLELPIVREVVGGMATILHAFEKSKANRIKLKNLQLLLSNGNHRRCKVYSIIKPCDTRWSSTLRSAERLILLRESINTIVRQPDSFWNHLISLHKFLTPFQIATDIIQRDSSTLMDVYIQFCNLLKYIDDIDSGNPFFSCRVQAKDIILSYWQNNINKNAVICCAMFSFDESYKNLFTSTERSAAEEWFFDFAAGVLWYYKMTDHDNLEVIKSTIRLQYGEFRSQSRAFSNVDQIQKDSKTLQLQMNQIKTNSNSSDTRTFSFWDPKLVWSQFLERALELSQSVLVLLSIPSSEAAVERSFSMQSQVHSKIRNRSADEQVETEMFIKMNTRALNGPSEYDGSWIEITDSYETIFEPSLFAPLKRPSASGAVADSDTVSDPLMEVVLPAQDDDPSVANIAEDEELVAYPDNPSDPVVEEGKSDTDHNYLDSPLSLGDFEDQDEDEQEVEHSPINSINDFVQSYVARHNIRPGTKFNADRINQLTDELLHARIKLNIVDAKELIMAAARRL
jgi:hypothetical protein